MVKALIFNGFVKIGRNIGYFHVFSIANLLKIGNFVTSKY